MVNPIQRLQSPKDYQEARANIFPSLASFDWYVRKHRCLLKAEKALLRIAGRNHIDPDRFDDVIIDVAMCTVQEVAA